MPWWLLAPVDEEADALDTFPDTATFPDEEPDVAALVVVLPVLSAPMPPGDPGTHRPLSQCSRPARQSLVDSQERPRTGGAHPDASATTPIPSIMDTRKGNLMAPR